MTPDRPGRDPLDVLADVERMARLAGQRIASGHTFNGRGALRAIEELAGDTVRHHREDAERVARAARATTPRSDRDLSARQEAIAELLALQYGRVAVEHADAGRIVLRGLTGDVEREILTVDRQGIEDGGGDTYAMLTMRRERMVRERYQREAADEPEPEGDGCEECGGWPPAGGCDLCGAVMAPTGPVA